MIYLPFARDRRLWLPSPYLRGGARGPKVNAVGTTNNAATGTVLTLTVPVTVPAGSALIVAAGYASIVGSETCVFTDSQTNTYALGNVNTTSNGGVTIRTSRTTTALVASTDTITMTLSTSRLNRFLGAWYLDPTSGLLTTLANDNTGTNANTGTSMQSGTITPTTIYTQFFGAFWRAAGAAATTPATGWTQTFDFNDGTAAFSAYMTTEPQGDVTSRLQGSHVSGGAAQRWVSAAFGLKGTGAQRGVGSPAFGAALGSGVR